MTTISEFDRLWIFSKIKGFYSSDLYFKYLHQPIQLATLKSTLLIHDTFESLIPALPSDLTRIYRKSDRNGQPLLYEYPSVSFQIESLISTLRDFYKIQKEAIGPVRRTFGHKLKEANLEYFKVRKHSENFEFSLYDKVINSALKENFSDEYTAFEKSIRESAETIVSKSKETKTFNALIVQSDIAGFFHNLDMEGMLSFFEAKYSKNTRVIKALKKTACDFETLPVGWMFSGVVADIFINAYQKEVRSKLQSKISKILNNPILIREISSQVFEREFESEKSKRIEYLTKDKINFIECFSYVDDFVFVLEISERVDDKDTRIVEDFFSKLVVTCAEEVLNETWKFKNKLELYKTRDTKLQVFLLNSANINKIESNFIQMNRDNDYSSGTLDLWSRLDEFLLPADNELILNERVHFFNHLKNLRSKIIEGQRLSQNEKKEVLGKVKIKLKGENSRYVSSALRIIEAIAAAHIPDEKESSLAFVASEVEELFNIFWASGVPLNVWLSFFNSLFRLYRKLNFPPEIDFFSYYEKFSIHMKNRVIKSRELHDQILIENIYYNYRLLIVLHKSSLPVISKSNFSPDVFAFKYTYRVTRKLCKKIFDDSILASPANLIAATNSLLRYRHKYFGKDEYVSIVRYIAESLPSFTESFLSDTLQSTYELFCAHSVSEFEALTSSFSVSKEFKRKIDNIFKCFKRFEVSYIEKNFDEKIEKAIKVLEDKENIPVPSSVGKRAIQNPKALNTFFYSLMANDGRDLYRFYYSSILTLDSERSSYIATIPQKISHSSLAFLNIIRIIRTVVVDGKTKIIIDPENAINKILKILRSELVKYRHATVVNNFKMEGVSEIDLNHDIFDLGSSWSKELKVTLAPIGISVDWFDSTRSLSFKKDVVEYLDFKVESAISEASKHGASMIVFPELTLPRIYLKKYLSMCAKSKMVLVGGVEYLSTKTKDAHNVTVISFPVDKDKNPLGQPYLLFEQMKHYPAAAENFDLLCHGFKYIPGRNLFIFNRGKFGNFAVLTCSDFLSMKLRLKVQEKIHLLIVPAQNEDSPTYDHIAETCLRDIHCYSAICNNPNLGSSFIYAPFYDKNKRIQLQKIGITTPESLTVTISPSELMLPHSADSQLPFRTEKILKSLEKKKGKGYDKGKDLASKIDSGLKIYKQTPPDWKKN